MSKITNIEKNFIWINDEINGEFIFDISKVKTLCCNKYEDYNDDWKENSYLIIDADEFYYNSTEECEEDLKIICGLFIKYNVIDINTTRI